MDGLRRDPEAPQLRWADHPQTKRPVLLTAFEGWNDAGDSATTAASYLHDRWDASLFADIDPEEFFDFTATRPRVEFDETGGRQLIWPATEFSIARIPDTGRDLIILRGVEPDLRWRTYCEHVLTLIRRLDIGLVISLGALLAEVPHTRPVSVFGAAYDEQIIERLGLSPSSYEGPTGIIGVLHAACLEADIPSASLWAAVPTYIPGSPSPMAALALVDRACEMLDASVPTDELEVASTAYVEQIDELIEDNEETAEYVASLEEAYDVEVADPTSESLVAEVENYLREQRG